MMTGDLSGEEEGACYGCALELKAEEPAAGLTVSNWPYGLCGGMRQQTEQQEGVKTTALAALGLRHQSPVLCES